HTMTGAEHVEPVIEPWLGGRIFERARGGVEVDWGRVVRFDPPLHFGFRWHLGTTAEQATDVQLAFVGNGSGGTTVELVHSGWDRLGADASDRRERNTAGWTAVFDHFRPYAEAPQVP
ncbi:MAG: SRPBCC domain-containing protein, partial [Geodermatophilaceae bacterium]